MENEPLGKDKLTDHNYDGIQEYDNQLPRWWFYLFIFTIIFAGGYFYYYQMSGIGTSLHAHYMHRLRQFEIQKMKNQSGQAPATEEALEALAKDPNVVKKGSAIFKTHCVSCHGAQGQGLVGPNLTDNYWLHGNKLTQIVHTIREGVPDKGMLSWKAVLKPDEIEDVAAFIKSIHGKKVPHPKASQGELYPD